MLIEFSVTNFKSVRETQTLSMVASSRISKKENVIWPEVKGEDLPPLLKVAAIYGPNASGKSTILKALGIARVLIKREGPPTGKLPVDSFRFDPALATEPSVFEYNFIHEGLRYYYKIGATTNRITHEELKSYPRGKEKPLFLRTVIDDKEHYKFGDSLEGGPQVHEAWRRITNKHSLFLAQAAENSSEDTTELSAPYNWFINGFLTLESNTFRGWSRATRKVLSVVPSSSESLTDFLKEVDIPISDIAITAKDPDKELEKEPSFADGEFEGFEDNTTTTLTHTSALGAAQFDFDEESEGTKNLIGFWLPWYTLGETGASVCLGIDELDSSLHPKIVEDIIRKHIQTSDSSQLIFTTHNTHLMSVKMLRRDQFWVTERDRNAATKLYSVYDFEGREGENLETRYHAGRYRGLPILKR